MADRLEDMRKYSTMAGEIEMVAACNVLESTILVLTPKLDVLSTYEPFKVGS